VPDGTTVVFSAHGVAPAVREEAARRELNVIDATCPLVAKVHNEARRFAGRGDTVLLIGHDKHDETEGTLGEVPGRITLVQNPEEAERVQVADPEKVAFLMQTTLAVDDTARLVARLRERFPNLVGPGKDDICYASQNRQAAVKAIAPDCDVVLIAGARNSSNSNRLVDVARAQGTAAHLVPDAPALEPAWLDRARVVGVGAGASAPPRLVDAILARLAELGYDDVEERAITRETISFPLPKVSA
jgi:4-hydroxy-3-methylbut-2-enyl diphosphate reductase